MAEGGERARETSEAVARRSYGKLVAFLAARTRDVAAAEDALSDAFAAALADWPNRGVPQNPEGWLVTAARRKLIDLARRRQVSEAGSEHLKLMSEELASLEISDIPDRRLALMFACAHPAIEPAARAPLILQTVLGFDAATIASALLVSPGSMRQRLVRAKTKIKHAGIPFRVPERDLRERLDAVLEATYAVYAEGWSDPAGTDSRRRNLAEEGIWLARLIASLLPEEPEVLGLLALMLHTEARRPARRDDDGEFVRLSEQNTQLWHGELIDEAEALLQRASQLAVIGRYQLEAAVQSAHAVRRLTGHTDWTAIEKLYDALLTLTDSPVVAINRAVAIAEARGAEHGMAELDRLADNKRLMEYQPYWAARAGLLAKLGKPEDADKAFERAIGLESDPAVRRFLQRRRAALHSTAR